MKQPIPGDVFLRIEFNDDERTPGFTESLLQAMRLKSKPPRTAILDYRLVDEVRQHTIFFRVPDDEGLCSEWLAEWLDWQVDAHLLTDQGVPLPPDQLYSITGSRELPFPTTKENP